MKLISDEESKFTSVTTKTGVVPGPSSDLWGWLPVLSLSCALGVFLLALSAEAGRLSSQWANPLFWLGLLVLYVPVTVRIISPKPARRERIALVVMLGFLLSLFRFLEQPLSFAFNDEFAQWRTALDIATSGHLFQPNPLLTISPFYPGLQIITNALSDVTGLSIFLSGMIVLSVAGLMLLLALYLFYEYLCGSSQIASIAMLLYMAKPTFFQDTLYHYEDLALPLIGFVLFAIVYRSYTSKGRRIGLTFIIWLAIAAVVVTHHVASYLLVAILLLWTVVFLILKITAKFLPGRIQRIQAGPGEAVLVGFALITVWTAYTGGRLADYLLPTIQTTVSEFVQILSGQSAFRQAFHSSTGYVEPLWERVVSYASVLLIGLGLPFGLFQIWRRLRANAGALALAVGSFTYPVIIGLRLTNAGDNIGGRAQPYVFEAVAFVLAVGIVYFLGSRIPNWRYSMLLTSAMAVIFIGGWVIGTSPDWNRFPGSYEVYADQRSITLESVDAAQWASTYLGPGNRIIGDHVNLLLMGTYADEWLVTASSEQIVVTPVFTSPQFNNYVVSLLQQGKIQYIIVDHRLDLPGIGWYDGVGPIDYSHTTPTNSVALSKFNSVPNVSRVFDSGNIVIYDVQAIINAASPVAGSPPPSSCSPATSASSSFPNVANHYNGTLYDIPTGLKANISFTGVQQKQGVICGYFGGMPANSSFTEIPANGAFIGTITTTKQIEFRVTNNKENMIFSFEGTLLTDGSLAGTYCGQESATGSCIDYGLWSVSPAK